MTVADDRKPDDNKRDMNVAFRVTERTQIDLMRLAAAEDCSLSEFMNRLVRRNLYGMVTPDDPTAQ